ncbi:unnamed protein product [Ectocarpus fasciculatus]
MTTVGASSDKGLLGQQTEHLRRCVVESLSAPGFQQRDRHACLFISCRLLLGELLLLYTTPAADNPYRTRKGRRRSPQSEGVEPGDRKNRDRRHACLLRFSC